MTMLESIKNNIVLELIRVHGKSILSKISDLELNKLVYKHIVDKAIDIELI